MPQDIAYTHKQVGVNARTIVNLIYVIGRTVYLLGKPRVFPTLLLHFRLYQRTYMYVLNFVHKKACAVRFGLLISIEGVWNNL